MKAPILESERLIYKPLSLSHLSQNYVDWMNDYEVNKYMTIRGDYTIEILKSFLQQVEKDEKLFWAVHIKSTNKHIGNIKIDNIIERDGLGTLGIMMGDKTEWGKGYAKETSIAIINYCFNELNIRKMLLGVVEDNINAYKLYESLGFLKEGFYKDHGFYDGAYRNTISMSLFNKNYKKK